MQDDPMKMIYRACSGNVIRSEVELIREFEAIIDFRDTVAFQAKTQKANNQDRRESFEVRCENVLPFLDIIFDATLPLELLLN
jgi:hypothetical protein